MYSSSNTLSGIFSFSNMLSRTISATCQILLIFWLFGLPEARGQGYTGPGKVSDIIPPGPTAASLGKFASTPVSTYTGTPRITIPIWEIKTSQLQLPVSLSYHAGGIKADEVASWVGLGWTLNAGGVVTRAVRGLPDESSYGFINPNVPMPTSTMISGQAQTQSEFELLHNHARGVYDGQPDLFYFNFAGKTGSFVLGRNGSVHVMPYQKIKIEFIGQNFTSWKITTEDGTIYQFGASEGTASRTTNSRTGTPPATSFKSSWFLTGITSPNGETATFDYTDYATDFYPVGLTESFYIYDYIQSLDGFGACPPMATPSGYETSRSEMQLSGKRLSKIHFLGGEIEFIAGADRCDLVGDKTLQEIVVKDHDLVPIKKIALTYVPGTTYLPVPASSILTQRLMLQQVQISDPAGSLREEPYVFEYFGGQPTRLSAAQDHWGYSNANGSGSLIPETQFTRSQNGVTTTLGTANRNPDLGSARARTLQKITYPTKGFTVFDYELHTSTPALSPGQTSTVQRSTNLGSTNYSFENPKSFTITNAAGANARVNVSLIVPASTPAYSPFSASFQSDPRTWPMYFEIFAVSPYRLIWSSQGRTTAIAPFTLNLPPGDYGMRMGSTSPHPALNFANYPFNTSTGIIYNMTMSWTETLPPNTTDQAVGGLRIRKVSDYTAAGKKATEKSYQYELDNGRSSGSIIRFPNYSFRYKERLLCYLANIAAAAEVHMYVLCSTPNYSVGTTQGAPVGYSQVTVYEGQDLATTDLGLHGKSVFTYYSPRDVGDFNGYGVFPFVPAESNDWQRGMVRSEAHFKRVNAAYQPVKRIDYNYTLHTYTRPNSNYSEVVGWKVSYETKYLNTGGETYLSDPTRFACMNFVARSEYYELSSKTETMYDNVGTGTTTTVTGYEYGLTHLQPIRTTTYAGSNPDRRFIAETKYPADYSDADAGPVIMAMKGARFLHNAPVEQVQKTWTSGTGERVVAATVHKYNFFPSGNTAQPLILPEQTWRLQATEPAAASVLSYRPAVHSAPPVPYRRDVAYAYDAQGNTLSTTREADVPTAYVWGYQQAKPIAKAVGASIDAVAFTSFEPEATGRWQYDLQGSHFVTTNYTGTRAYQLDGTSTGAVQSRQLPAGEYELLVWGHGVAAPMIAGASRQRYELAAVAGNTGWRQHRFRLSVPANGTITLNSNFSNAPQLISIDELRLFPVGSQLTSFTYRPLVGITSQTDPSGRTVHYEYDALGRLVRTRDEQGRILTQQQYHYAGH